MSHASPLQPPVHLQTPASQVPWFAQLLKHVAGAAAGPAAGAGAGGAGCATIVLEVFVVQVCLIW